MKCLIIDHKTAYKKELLNFLSGFSPKMVDYEEFNPKETESFDFIVLSGGPIHISAEEDIKKEKEFIRNTNKPILGICLGLQIFGAMFGSKLFELDRLRKGFFNFELHGEKGTCYFNHKWFVKDAPPEFEVLRRNEEIIEALRHKTKPFLGVQCHPEISGEYGEKIKKIFIEEYVKPSLDSSTTEGLSSLPKASD